MARTRSGSKLSILTVMCVCEAAAAGVRCEAGDDPHSFGGETHSFSRFAIFLRGRLLSLI